MNRLDLYVRACTEDYVVNEADEGHERIGDERDVSLLHEMSVVLCDFPVKVDGGVMCFLHTLPYIVTSEMSVMEAHTHAAR